jgi:ferredoxin-thioredoxin reductase catalytic subunit
MKRYWRCFVCNDIHYGVKPPEICPTCSVRHAYIEVTSEEARKVGSLTEVEFTEADFRAAIERFTEGNEFQVTTDKERIDMLLAGIFNNERNHGLKYCPCRLACRDFAEDLKIVCPCNFLVHETYKGKEDGECWCGLFIRRKK